MMNCSRCGRLSAGLTDGRCAECEEDHTRRLAAEATAKISRACDVLRAERDAARAERDAARLDQRKTQELCDALMIAEMLASSERDAALAKGRKEALRDAAEMVVRDAEVIFQGDRYALRDAILACPHDDSKEKP